MPKTLQKISTFNGGLNLDVNQLDLDDSEAVQLDGWSVSTVGELKIGGGNGIAQSYTYSTSLTQAEGAVNGAYHMASATEIWPHGPTVTHASYDPGYGFTTFNSDVDMDLPPVPKSTEFIVGTKDRNILIYDPNHTDGLEIYNVLFPDDVVKVIFEAANACTAYGLAVGQMVAFDDAAGPLANDRVSFDSTRGYPIFEVASVSNSGSEDTSFITLKDTNLNDQSCTWTAETGKLFRRWLPNYSDGVLASTLSANNHAPIYFVADGNLRIYNANSQSAAGTWLGFVNRKRWTAGTDAYIVNQWIAGSTNVTSPGSVVTGETVPAADDIVHINLNDSADTNAIGWNIASGGPASSAFDIGVSYIYDGNQESPITQSNASFSTAADKAYSLKVTVLTDKPAGGTPSYDAMFGGATPGHIWNERITGMKVYIKEDSTGEFSRDFWLAAEVDIDRGVKKPQDATYSSWTDEGAGVKASTGIYVSPPRTVTYESLNGRKWDESTDARFKTATIANRRTYIGNVNHTPIGGAARQFEDRLMKTYANNFDIFPPGNFVDAVLGDGESIIRLVAFGDRILQFKQNTMYIINVSQDTEFLEATHKQMGVSHPGAICSTPDGIAWVNKQGVHFFDGQGIKTLTEGKIGSQMEDIVYDDAQLGYDTNSGKLILLRSSNQAIADGHEMYAVDTALGAITKLNPGFQGLTANINEHFSNFFNTANGDLLIGHDGLTLLKYYDGVADIDISGTGAVDSVWKSKLYDFGDLALNKKVYKVQLTYKNGTASGNTGLVPKWFDESGTESSFYDEAGVEFTAIASKSVWTSIDLFTSSSSYSYIKGFQLQLTQTGSAAQSGYEELQINDMSIYYRILGPH